MQPVVADAKNSAYIATSLEQIIQCIVNEAKSGDVVIIMSNGGFGDLHQKLIQVLKNKN